MSGIETILIVDDDDLVREIPVIVLTDAGYTVLEATGAEEAFDRLNRHHVDLLFTDIAMPGVTNGVGIAEKALTDNPRLKVLFTTGFRGSEQTTVAPWMKDHPVIYKPYNIDTLVETVRALLDG